MKMLKPVLTVIIILTVTLANAQSAPKDWMLADPAHDSLAGTSTTRAYNELLKGRTSTTVIVAVIDNGVDVEHPDLKANIWTNPKEIPGNGIDDDGNGYVDDIHGWDFIGGKNGNINQDNLEITREYKRLTKLYANTDSKKLSGDDKKQYERYQKIKKSYETRMTNAKDQYNLLNYIYKGMRAIQVATGKTDFGMTDLQGLNTDNNDTMRIYKSVFMRILGGGTGLDSTNMAKEVEAEYKQTETQFKYQYDTSFNPRYIVGDVYTDFKNRSYGNADVSHPTPEHGTHVSGIIAAVRGNGIGIDGIADNVKIMPVRCVPDGDERDKDVANSIRYAVDNGAKVINMSFGKSISPYKSYVDSAVQYAVAHDVLLIHAAGNEAADNDVKDNFPCALYKNGSKAATWIEVGAIDDHFKPASFSNYGHKSVDLFSPGVDIYSSVPNGEYAFFSGTSMASPVCAGVAAVIRSYFPQLTALQVKQVLLASTYQYTAKVPIPGSSNDPTIEKKRSHIGRILHPHHPTKMVKNNNTTTLSKICVTGGIVNLYQAIKYADAMTKKP